MARWTQDVYLMHKAANGWKKLVDIKDFPDLGSEPEQIETTTLSTIANRTYISGLQDSGVLSFTANYDKAEYDALVALSKRGEQFFGLFMGADGSEGAWYWSGVISVRLMGKGQNEVAEVTVSSSVSSEIVTEDPTTVAP